MGETLRATLDDTLGPTLAELDKAALRRRLRPLDSGIGPRVTVDGRSVIQLCSNDYLGLSSHPLVKEATTNAVSNYGSGAGSARLIVGTSLPHVQLEARLATFKRTEAAVVLPSGYQANVGILQALTGPGDVIFSDELNHASIIDGCRHSRAAVEVYRHRDVNHLGTLLSVNAGARRRLIITETVFAMDGDLAPLNEIVAVAKRYNASIAVDEAHATGVFGATGAGLVEKYELWDSIDVQIGTLSKAVGALGGFIAGSQAVIDTVINSARTFIFTTGLPPMVAAAAQAAIQIIVDEPTRRTKLWRNASFLQEHLVAAGYTITETASPILPVLVGDSATSISLSETLLKNGVLVPAIRPPTVPPGTARLRVTPMATHTKSDLTTAVKVFTDAKQQLETR